MPTRTLVLALGSLALLACASPRDLELPLAPEPELLTRARALRPLPPQRVSVRLAPGLAELSIQLTYRDQLHRYNVLVGRSLQRRLRDVVTAALGESTPGAPPLELSFSAPHADCEFVEGQALARVSLAVEARRGAEILAKRTLRGEGVSSLSNAFSFDVGGRIERAFAAALTRLDIRQLVFLRGLQIGATAPLASAAVTTPASPAEPAPLPRAEPLADLAEVDELQALGDLAGAEACLDELIVRFPDHPLLLARRGALRLTRGRLDAALSDCDRALALDDRLARALATRAMVHAERGESALAKADCDAALARPHSPALAAYIARVRERLAR